MTRQADHGGDRPAGSLLRVLAENRAYRMFWSGISVSNLGTWMQMVAQDWLVLVVLDAGPAALGLTTALQLVPALIAAPVGGLLADRLSKRRLLMVTNALGGLCGFTLGVLVVTGNIEVWHVYLLAFLLGSVRAADSPPRLAYASELVARGDVARAVALSSLSFNVARLAGPGLAGVLIAVLGTGPVFLLNAASFFVPIGALFLIGRDGRWGSRGAVVTSRPTERRLRDAVEYVRHQPELVSTIILMFVVATFAMNIPIVIALMSTEVYGVGSAEFGVLGSIMAVGSLIGGLSVARLTPRHRTVVIAALALGATLFLQGLMPSYIAFAATMPLVGILSVTVNISAHSHIQIMSVPQMRGRVISMVTMANAVGRPVSALTLGWVAEVVGARWVPIGCGVLTGVGVGLTVLFTRRAERRNFRS